MSLSFVRGRKIIRDIVQATKGKIKAVKPLTKSVTQEEKADKLKDYAFVMFYSEEDRCWVADVPDLKYCSAFGDTPEQAVKEIQVAVNGWLESAKINGTPVPQPHFDARHLNMRDTLEHPEVKNGNPTAHVF
jgi:predicted RNase H-like HicB family nuclease